MSPTTKKLLLSLHSHLCIFFRRISTFIFVDAFILLSIVSYIFFNFSTCHKKQEAGLRYDHFDCVLHFHLSTVTHYIYLCFPLRHNLTEFPKHAL